MCGHFSGTKGNGTVNTLKDLKKRQKLVQKITRMTSAIKMASQAKMARARTENQVHKKGCDDILSVLQRMQKEWSTSPQMHSICSPLCNNIPEPGAPWIVLILSSDRGLCGHFNNIIKQKAQNFLDHFSQEKNEPIHVASIGCVNIDTYPKTTLCPFTKMADLCANMNDLVHNISHAFIHNQIRGVHIITQKFVNILTQVPDITQLLPLSLPRINNDQTKTRGLLSYDPCPQSIFCDLTKAYLAFLVCSLIKEQSLSEHSARFLAMDSASENAHKMSKKLSVEYNRLRQKKITTEILELSAAGCA